MTTTDMQSIEHALRALVLSASSVGATHDQTAKYFIEAMDSIKSFASRPDAHADERGAFEPIDYDGVVSICDAHGIGLPVDCVEMVVEIIRHASRAAAPQPAFEAVQAVLREVDPKWRERGEFGVKPHAQAIAAIRDLAAAAPQAEAAQGVPDAYVPIHPRNGPLWASAVPTLASDHPAHYEMRPVYFAAAPSPDREQVGEISEAARIVKMWDDGFTQLAGKRAIDMLRDASPSRESGERQPDACAHDYVRSDRICTECGERQGETFEDWVERYRQGKPYWSTARIEICRDAWNAALAASAPTLGEPGPSCDPGDICAGCRCRYNKYIDDATAVAHPLTDTQRGRYEFRDTGPLETGDFA